MLELYYHLHDEESQKAMQALANSTISAGILRCENSPLEGNLRAKGQYKIEKTLQVPEVQELMLTLSDITERAGFEPAVRTKPHTAFPRRLLRPLGHLSRAKPPF